MSNTKSNKGCGRCAALRARCEDLEAENARLRSQIETLEARVEELQQAGKRQAAPFRLPETKRNQNPKRPGRKPGHPGARRAKPAHVDVEVEAPLEACPHCGGEVTDVQPVEQYIEDLPEPVRPFVTKVVTYRGRCRGCRRRVQSRHPQQVSSAAGAAGVHLGPRALALSAMLHHELGLTLRKTCQVLEALGGLRITPGGLTQALARVGERLEGAYEALHQAIRQSPAVYADETSWWVGGPGHWLWVFTTPEHTLYKIEPGRGKAVVNEVLGDRFSGRLVSDCLSSYDAIGCKKHKCYAHHLRAIAEAQRLAPQSQWLNDLRLMLAGASALAEAPEANPDLAYRRKHLEAWADRLLATPREDPHEEQVAKRLRKAREPLFGCLYEPYTEATNNRAERQLRPAVIARKLSCGNKTEAGKHTAEILMSVAATARQGGKTLVERIVALFTSPTQDNRQDPKAA